MNKTCARCLESFPIGSFAIRKSTGKPVSYCRECFCWYRRQSYKSKPEPYKARKRAADLKAKPNRKICPGCEMSKCLNQFKYEGQHPLCRVCDNSTKSPLEKKLEKSAARSAYRQNPANIAKVLFRDNIKVDKRKNRSSEGLTEAFVRDLISNGCSYCGSQHTELRMTLDRIDNSRGHSSDNVVAACIRCNYARGAMPYEAWLELVPGVKSAKEKGLFGDWTGRARIFRKRKTTL